LAVSMASQATLDLVHFMVNIRYKLGCSAYHVVEDRDKDGQHQFALGTRAHKYIWLCFTIVNIAVKVFYIYGLGIIFELTREISMIFRCQFYALASVASAEGLALSL